MSVVIAGVLSWVVVSGCATAPTEKSTRAESDRPAVVAGDAAAGKAVYDANCAACHKLGRYDTEGRHNLSGDDDDVTLSFVSGHHGEDLSEADVAALRAFIATY